MNIKLSREHLGKVLKIDTPCSLDLLAGVFNPGDVVIIFNNTDITLDLYSNISNSYVSGVNERKMFFSFPPKSLANFVLVDKNIVVFSGEVK